MTQYPTLIDPARFPETPAGFKGSFNAAFVTCIVFTVFTGIIATISFIGFIGLVADPYASEDDLLLALMGFGGSLGAFLSCLIVMLFIRIGSALEKALWVTNYHLVQIRDASRDTLLP